MDDKRLREMEQESETTTEIGHMWLQRIADLIAEIRRLRGLVDDALAGMEELDPHHIAVQHNRVRIARDWGDDG